MTYSAKPSPPPPPDEHEPYARITRLGRWLYSVEVADGLIGEREPPRVFGRSRAEKLARRRLARHVRESSPEQWTIPAEARTKPARNGHE